MLASDITWAKSELYVQQLSPYTTWLLWILANILSEFMIFVNVFDGRTRNRAFQLFGHQVCFLHCVCRGGLGNNILFVVICILWCRYSACWETSPTLTRTGWNAHILWLLFVLSVFVDFVFPGGYFGSHVGHFGCPHPSRPQEGSRLRKCLCSMISGTNP